MWNKVMYVGKDDINISIGMNLDFSIIYIVINQYKNLNHLDSMIDI